MAHVQDYGPAAPHGPDMSGTHDPIHNMTDKEKQIFDYLIKPNDSYGWKQAFPERIHHRHHQQ
jgi:hypothetical protein